MYTYNIEPYANFERVAARILRPNGYLQELKKGFCDWDDAETYAKNAVDVLNHISCITDEVA